MYGTNNYGYNPYGRYNNQPIQTQTDQFNSIQRYSGLLGKQVDSIDVVKSMDIPLDGSVSYFPLTNGSAIVSKQLQMDGTSKIIIYKPVQEEAGVKYATMEDISKIDDLEEEIKEIKKSIKDLKKKGE